MPNPEAIYRQLGALLAEAPDLTAVDAGYGFPKETHVWLGRVVAQVRQLDRHSFDVIKLEVAIDFLIKMQGRKSFAEEVMLLLHRALAIAEAAAPASAQGAFVSAGDPFDALAAVSSVLRVAKAGVLIVDPYMDGTTLTDIAVLVPDGVPLELLADEASVKASFQPAVSAWIKQYGTARPLMARLAPPKSLHDRLLIVDDREAWILIQSLKDFAKRSPATLQRTDPEAGAMKVHAYRDLWTRSADVPANP